MNRNYKLCYVSYQTRGLWALRLLEAAISSVCMALRQPNRSDRGVSE